MSVYGFDPSIPWPWIWIWIFKTKFWNSYILGMEGSINMEWKWYE